jgi:hypothetical protein
MQLSKLSRGIGDSKTVHFRIPIFENWVVANNWLPLCSKNLDS